MVDNSKNPALVPAYTCDGGAHHGTVFYAFENVLNIGTLRGLSAEKAAQFADMKITERSLRELIKECKIAAGAGDLVKAFSMIQEIDYRLNFICEENSILDLVCIYFMLQDEDPEVASEAMNKKKHKIFEEDPKARAFFLRIGVDIMSKLSGKPADDLNSYLKENQNLSDRIRRYIASESSINSMST